MPGASLLTLLDDIATILDDVAVMTKVAARKTAGVLGDDLALNAEQVSGVRASRELPVVWAVFKGSALNKCILVPAALAISAVFPAAITPLLMLGGAYLCFEGFEKIAHAWAESREEHEQRHKAQVEANRNPDVDLVAFERDKIKGAIRTDFILSAEIIVIALGTVQSMPLPTQIGVVVAIAIVMTVGVYGLVAGIVRLDDVGLHLAAREGKTTADAIRRRLGEGMLTFAPYLMKSLAIVGTAAMFLVGGGILVHGLPPLADVAHAAETLAAGLPMSAVLTVASGVLVNAFVGLLAGAVLVGGLAGINRMRGKPAV